MWKMFIPILMVFSLSLMIANCNSKKLSENDVVVPVSDDDQEMNAAMQKARNTLNEFIERFTHPRTSDKWFPGLKFKQQVSVPLDNISDWMYVSDGRLIGGFTSRVLYGRMSPEERKQDDSGRPYRIE
jgi:uncharacterized protein YegJ (DUF2314 family)